MTYALSIEILRRWAWCCDRRRPSPWRFAVGLLALWISLAAGCRANEQKANSPRDAIPPLKPLVYTELPNLTPEAIEVRERRLMRQLLEGVSEEGQTWGLLGREKSEDWALDDPQQVATQLLRAVDSGGEASWEQLFVRPEVYAELMGVKREEAQRFVDELLAEADQVWRLLHIPHVSQAPEGGLSALFSKVELQLGSARTLDGQPAAAESEAVQYWESRLRLYLKSSGEIEKVFEIKIPKILKVVDSGRSGHQRPIFQIASPLEPDEQLETFVEVGLHLKPELLRSQEYPFPLSVGNFWRYTRKRLQQSAFQAVPDQGAAVQAKGKAPSKLERDVVSELFVEVVSVARFGTWRMVEMRHTYGEALDTPFIQTWLVTPRRIYLCDEVCQEHPDDLSKVLDFLQQAVPLYIFPIQRGQVWGSTKQIEHHVMQRLVDVDVSAGYFVASWQIVHDHGLGGAPGSPTEEVEREYRRLKEVFAVGKGIVQRTWSQPRDAKAQKDLAESAPVLVEELIEYRLVP